MAEVFKKSLMKYLITGFETFGGHLVNPSSEFVKNFDFPNFDKVILPVDYEQCLQEINKFPLGDYDFVFLLGLAADRKEVCFERVALNWIESPISDNKGQSPKPQKIDETREAAVINPLPLESWTSLLSQEPLPVKVSHSAGAYLCNFLYFHVLQKTSKALFIHLPKEPDFVLLSELMRNLVRLLESR